MKNKIITFTSLLLILIGVILLGSNYLQEKVDKSYNNMNLKLLAYNDSLNYVDEELDGNTDQTEEEKPKEEKPKVVYDYVGKLIIPKINLERGFVGKNSKYNSIHYGIETHSISTYPKVRNGNLILLSHSGSSYQCYFRYLYKLVVGDVCYVEYQGVKYKYVITKIYTQPKIGKVVIDRNYQKTTLTLITCTHNSKTEQTVYIAEMV